MFVRRRDLAASMSDYLVRTIEATNNIDVLVRTTSSTAAERDDEELVPPNGIARQTWRAVPAAALFILIGARPHTDWLPERSARVRHGFILAGSDPDLRGWRHHRLARSPLLLESSVPGVFAAGDVRAIAR